MRRRKRILDDLDEDIRHHIEQETQDNIERGMPPQEARHAALRKFGNVTRVKEQTREVWSVVWLESLAQDIRFALRMLHKSPGFTVVAVLTLALGIGANSAIFSIVNGVLLRPLPYAAPDRIMILYESSPQHGFAQFSASPPNFVDWREQSRTFERMAAFVGDWYSFSFGGVAERIRGKYVTQDFFAILGVNPAIGRAFVPEEFQHGKDNVALISHGFWQRAFGGTPNAVGQSIELDGKPTIIVGVLPNGFDFEDSKAQVWTPLTFDEDAMRHRGAKYLSVVGLLRSGTHYAQANQDLTAVAKHLEQQYPDTNSGWTAFAVSLREDIVGQVKSALLVLFAAVALVLLIACANTANMLLARASVRRREIALRTALGAGRVRLISQLLLESLVLSTLGGVTGLALAWVAVQAVRTLPHSYLPMAYTVNIDTRVLVFTLFVALISSLLFGLAPAFLTSRCNVNETLKETGRTMGSTRSARLRNTVIISEVALSLTLFIASALVLRSFAKLTSVPPGFRTDHALSFMLNIPESRYATPIRQAQFFRQVEERMRSLPGVEGVALGSRLPLSGHFESYSVNLAGRPEEASDISVDYSLVNPDYFRVMGIPLIAGRLFTAQDVVGSPAVCLLNDQAARALFPNGNAIGQHIQLGRQHGAVREIVGVVGTVKDLRLWQKPRNEGYEPIAQRPDTDASVVLRSSGDPTLVVSAAREQIRQLDSQQPIAEVQTLDEMVANTLSLPRFRTVLLGTFAGLALLLATVGLYGVLSYSVTQRTQEIGIRLALGAQRSNICSGIVAQGMLLVGVGASLGAIASLWLTRFVATFLYGVTPRDPATIAVVVALFAAVAVVSSLIPARRAMRVDPMVALRYE